MAPLVRALALELPGLLPVALELELPEPWLGLEAAHWSLASQR